MRHDVLQSRHFGYHWTISRGTTLLVSQVKRQHHLIRVRRVYFTSISPNYSNPVWVNGTKRSSVSSLGRFATWGWCELALLSLYLTYHNWVFQNVFCNQLVQNFLCRTFPTISVPSRILTLSALYNLKSKTGWFAVENISCLVLLLTSKCLSRSVNRIVRWL